ncbi:MAG: hypothetical protein FJY88_02495 [Candidatus Eisenbacteria bacterium]|nr:hypothetical protein [Candidatus Eisenbacteria bacterium]
MSALPAFDGPYILEEERARGAVANLYRATSPVHGAVLVRIMNPRLAAAPSLVDQFRRNVELLSGLSHACLDRIIDKGASRGLPYFVGADHSRTLRERLASGALPLADSLRIAREISSAMAYGHTMGFAHLDLRPETVMIDRENRAVVCGFGLQTDPDRSALTMIGGFLTPPTYMSPEHWSGFAKPLTDAYSVGLILFEMLTGRPPFVDADPMRLCNMHTFERPPSLTDILPGASPALAGLVARLLEKKPADRTAGMAETAETIERIEAEIRGAEPIAALKRPAPASGKTQLSESPADRIPRAPTVSSGSETQPLRAVPKSPRMEQERPLAPQAFPPTPPPVSFQTPARSDPTWLRPAEGAETKYFAPEELRRIGGGRREKGVPFWLWVLLAVVVTVVVVLLLLEPWSRPAPPESSLPRAPAQAEQSVAANLPPLQDPQGPPAASLREADRSTPTRAESQQDRRPTSPERRQSPQPAAPAAEPQSYDWTAPGVTLVVSATDTDSSLVAASILVDGRPVGEQTTKEIVVGPGQRRVSVVRSGMRPVLAYLDSRRIPVEDGDVVVALEPGKTARLRFVLRRS